MSALPALPAVSAIACALAIQIAPARRRGALLVGGTALHLALALTLFVGVEEHGIAVLQVGSWPSPLGIALVADRFAASLVLLCGLLGFAVALQSVRALPREGTLPGLALFPLLLAGCDAAFLAGDLFHLYVAIEVALMASFALLAGDGREGRREAAVELLLPSLFASTLLLIAIGLLYAEVGTLDLAGIAIALEALPGGPMRTAAAGLLLLAFGIKAAAFPIHAWLPASYARAPGEVAALFSGLLTKIGIYALVRIFTLILPAERSWMAPVLLWVAAATMVIGVLGAIAQVEVQRLLCFHIVSQIGYLLAGLALGSALALAGTVYYLFHNSVAKTALLLCSCWMRERAGSDRLAELGGLARGAPWLAGLFLLSALSLAGIPPLSGFWAKLLVLDSALEAGSPAIATVAAAVGLLTLFSMSKIWIQAFWGERAAPGAGPLRAGFRDLLPLGLLAGAGIALGLGAGPAVDFALRAGEELLDRSIYLGAVRGGGN
jgi:multicomponent Na+:H+ antiporter subunit D